MADISFASAVTAYADSLARGGEVGVDQQVATVRQSAGAADGGQFASLVESALQAARETGERAEAMSGAAVKGEAGLHEVVTAVANAEVTLQTVMAVRDRVITAYQDILRMPI